MKIRFGTRPESPNRAIAAPSEEARALLARLDQHNFKSEPEDILPILAEQGWRVLVGIGERVKLDAAALRRIGGSLFGEIAGGGIQSLAVDLGLTPAQTAELAYGIRLRAWRVAKKYRQKPDPEKAWHLSEIALVTDAPGAASACFERLEQTAKAVHFARDLVAAPGNDLTPPAFVEALRGIKGVTMEVVDPTKAGLGLLSAVGQGSAHAPALALLRWKGGRSREKPIVFVGKGITFDTGGIDIKPRDDMEEMKTDMAGGAAVAGLLMALAARGAPINAVGAIAIAENMPSGRSVRPGDVVKSYARKTVEIIDTDAEGRLALADALAYSAARYPPAAMIDLATLTGAVEVALGWERAGLFSNDDALADRLFAAGEAEDEKLWRLPLTDRYDEAIKSDIADIRNCAWEHGPDALHAARFLQHFVPDGVPWAHLDIAGMAEADEDAPLWGEGPTGFGIRLLDRMIKDGYEAAR